jgi:hypothetical protein
MAQVIQLRHKISGALQKGIYGFSWTTLFFGPFVPLFRGDFVALTLYLLVAGFLYLINPTGICASLANAIWAFFYNRIYTKELLWKGYEFADTRYKNEQAAYFLGVAIQADTETNSVNQEVSILVNNLPSASSTFSRGDKTLANDAYKIYLVKKYQLEFNDVLKKYIFDDKLFDSVDDALIAVMEVENFNSLG